MTVRWKPMLVLSGLFLVTAVLGLATIVYMMPRGPADLLAVARKDREAKEYANAAVQYRRALQQDGKNPKIHLEMAEMYAEWAAGTAPRKPADLPSLYLRSLAEAAKYGKQMPEPRRLLLADAIRQDEAAEAAEWAKQLIALEPGNLDAHYVLADEALTNSTPDLASARKHLEALEQEKSHRVRTDWVRARIALDSRDESELSRLLEASRTVRLPDGADPIDRVALLRLRVLDAQRTTDPDVLADRVDMIRKEASALTAGDDKEATPARISQVGFLLDQVQKDLTAAAERANQATKAKLTPLADGIEKVIEATFNKALAAGKAPNLRISRAYAEHLLARKQRKRCLEVVDQALKTPIAALPSFMQEAMELREVAVKSALSDADDPKRFERAKPYIDDLLASVAPRFQGLGHLFQGAIELEQSGLMSGAEGQADAVVAPASNSKLRVSALGHLKVAAAQWPTSTTAQALYGVALILSQEPALGRQYLQAARKLGGLEPRYQIWAAWSMVQAGYPEEAEPVVAELLNEIKQGKHSADMEGALRLLSGEVAQARGGAENLRKARAEYQKAIVGGRKVPAAVELRQAQLDVMLNEPEKGLARIARLRQEGRGGPAAEHLAVLILQEWKQEAQARKTLDEARTKYPASGELVGLDAALRLKEGKAEQADKILADFIARNLGHLGAIMTRAELLLDKLNRPDDARKLLVEAADRSENSAPMVQLAMLHLKLKDYKEAEATIKKIRARWKEAAAGDLLDAQLAAARNNPRAASSFLEAALKKDPDDKLALFWKAQLEDQSGSPEDAAKVYNGIVKDSPVKEISDGLSLATASKWALATLALENQDFDGAISGYQNLIRNDETGVLSRPARWKLVAAYSAKGKWPAAQAEINTLLRDPETSPDERVQAANYFRIHNENARANELLDQVLKAKPAHSGAVVTRAYMLTGDKHTDEAASLMRSAIAAVKQPPAVYLMLAAIENARDTGPDGMRKALDVLKQGLLAYPDSPDLAKAEFRVLKMMGDDKGAVAFMEGKAKADPKGVFQRMLVSVYRDEKQPEKARQVIEELIKANPKDATLATMHVKLLAGQAVEASDRGDRAAEKSLNDKTAALLRDYRVKFPTELSFPEVECDLAARRGDVARALEITREMDALDKHSTSGPLLRARLYEKQNWRQETARAYGEAVGRNPRRSDVRLAFGMASLAVGQADDALQQANWVLDASQSSPPAQLLKARALAALKGSASQVSTRREQAIALLRSAVKEQPKFTDAYHLSAEILLSQRRRAEAIAVLRDDLKANPEDAAGLSLLIQHLTEPRSEKQGPTPDELAEARALALEKGGKDSKGEFCLAIGVGYYKAKQLTLSLPWSEKAAKLLDAPIVHLNYGDLLLAVAEGKDDPASARPIFEQAIAEYDKVLKVQSNSLECVNNKAWILHRYLKKDQEALDLVEGFLKRVDPSTLPGEFYDTLGAIQESLGKKAAAEESYGKGLQKNPELPVLNYHMGRLVASDGTRAVKAANYLRKARDSSDKLPPAEAAEVVQLLRRVGP